MPWLRGVVDAVLGRRPKAPAAAPAAPAAPANPFQPAVDRIRLTASWLIAALAAVATVLLAGSQLSSVGALSPEEDPVRLVVAVVAALGAVGAIGYTIYRLTEAQMPGEGTLGQVRVAAQDPKSRISELARDDSGLRAGRTSLTRLLDDYEDLRAEERAADLALTDWRARLTAAGDATARKAVLAEKAGLTAAFAAAAERVTALRPHMVYLVQLSQYLTVRRRFTDERRRVLVGALTAAGLIVCFAWAANPPPADPAAADALPQNPTAGRLLLTAEGTEDLRGVLGASCATAAAEGGGIDVIAMASDDDGVEVVLVPGGSCAEPARLVVNKAQGRVVATDDVELPDG